MEKLINDLENFVNQNLCGSALNLETVTDISPERYKQLIDGEDIPNPKEIEAIKKLVY